MWINNRSRFDTGEYQFDTVDWMKEVNKRRDIATGGVAALDYVEETLKLPILICPTPL
jgi:hypothetical protein